MRSGKLNTTFKRERKNPLSSSSSQHLSVFVAFVVLWFGLSKFQNPESNTRSVECRNGSASSSVRALVWSTLLSPAHAGGIRSLKHAAHDWERTLRRLDYWRFERVGHISRGSFDHNLHHRCKCFRLAVLPGLPCLIWLNTFLLVRSLRLWIPFCFTVASWRDLCQTALTSLRCNAVALHNSPYDSAVSLYAFHLVFLTQLVSTHCPTRSSLRFPTFPFYLCSTLEYIWKMVLKVVFLSHLSLDIEARDADRDDNGLTNWQMNCLTKINNFKNVITVSRVCEWGIRSNRAGVISTTLVCSWSVQQTRSEIVTHAFTCTVCVMVFPWQRKMACTLFDLQLASPYRKMKKAFTQLLTSKCLEIVVVW